ncbi:MAG: 2-phospho-L-lactate transferase [Halioglobus sp.]
MSASTPTVLALSGGVGGAKLALGLAGVLPPEALHVVVNTGDDFEHLGLHISPDIDTLLYTLSGLADPVQGWGIAGESFHTLDALARLGGEVWFKLGDRDMATHLWRSEALRAGKSLSQVTAELAQRLDVPINVHPMSNDAVRTTVHTSEGSLPFQHYFVRERCEPAVTGFAFQGVEKARPNTAVMECLHSQRFTDIVICPSNPFVSIDPILRLPGLWHALRDAAAPVSLVSPIVAGMALKGPAAKMMSELGVPVTALGVAQHYAEQYPGLIDWFLIDASDATLAQSIGELGMQVAVTSTVMKTREDKQRLARFTLDLAGR